MNKEGLLTQHREHMPPKLTFVSGTALTNEIRINFISEGDKQELDQRTHQFADTVETQIVRGTN